METMLLKLLTEKLIALPFECALQTAQFVMTLGAPGFLPCAQPLCSPSSSRRTASAVACPHARLSFAHPSPTLGILVAGSSKRLC